MLRIVDEVSVCREGGGVLVEMGLARTAVNVSRFYNFHSPS